MCKYLANGLFLHVNACSPRFKKGDKIHEHETTFNIQTQQLKIQKVHAASSQSEMLIKKFFYDRDLLSLGICLPICKHYKNLVCTPPPKKSLHILSPIF